MKNLKPCPFCDEYVAAYVAVDGNPYLQCDGCNIIIISTPGIDLENLSSKFNSRIKDVEFKCGYSQALTDIIIKIRETAIGRNENV